MSNFSFINGVGVGDVNGDSNGEPIPLVQPKEVVKFPVDALGPVLADAARAISELTMTPLDISCQSLLCAVSFVAQSKINVVANHSPMPTSLFFLTIAESGEGKSSVDQIAMKPIYDYQKTLNDDYRLQMKSYELEKASYELAKSGILGKAKGKKITELQRRELDDLLEPIKPLSPFILAQEPTIEGLQRSFFVGHPSQGIVNDEGGQFFGGYGMSRDHFTKTITALSKFYDGSPISRIRAKDEESFLIYGCRLCLHLSMQPIMATKYLSNPEIHEQGFMPRFLISQPVTTQGSRLMNYSRASKELDPRISRFYEQLNSILETPYKTKEGTNQLDLKNLYLNDEAYYQYVGFFNVLQGEIKDGGHLHSIKSFAAKSAATACRLAAALQFFNNPSCEFVGGESMQSAIDAMDYYLTQMKNLRIENEENALNKDAEILKNWMFKKYELEKKSVFTRSELLVGAPSQARSSKKLSFLLSILEEFGYIHKAYSEDNRQRGRKSELWFLLVNN